jgi:hypothetical protein
MCGVVAASVCPDEFIHYNSERGDAPMKHKTTKFSLTALAVATTCAMAGAVQAGDTQAAFGAQEFVHGPLAYGYGERPMPRGMQPYGGREFGYGPPREWSAPPMPPRPEYPGMQSGPGFEGLPWAREGRTGEMPEMTEEMKQVMAEREERMKEMAAQREERMKEMAAEREERMKEMEAMREAHMQAMEAAREAFMAELPEDMRQAIAEREERMKEMEAERQAQLAEMEEMREARMKAMEAGREAYLAEMERQREAIMNMMDRQ